MAGHLRGREPPASSARPPAPTRPWSCSAASLGLAGRRAAACEGYGLDDRSSTACTRSRPPTVASRSASRLQPRVPLEALTSRAGTPPTGSKKIVFIRGQDRKSPPAGTSSSNVDGSGLRQITPAGHGPRRQRLRWPLLAQRRPDPLRGQVRGGGPQGDLDRRRGGRYPGAAADHPRLWRTADRWRVGATHPAGPRTASRSSSRATTPRTATRASASTSSYADGSGLIQVSDGKDDLPTWGTPAG